MGNMGSAHVLVEVNVSFKFEGNPSISKGVIERTRIGRRTDRPTDRRDKANPVYPPHILWWGYNEIKKLIHSETILHIMCNTCICLANYYQEL